jgi:RNA polymerase subunit RPABC4/transcription elongation factor Spt4
MAKTARQLEVQARHIYNSETKVCPHCEMALRARPYYQWRKTVQQLEGAVYVASRAKECVNPECAYQGQAYSSAAANPYDPKWESYFEKRLQRKMEAKLQGRRSLLYLWRSQNGVCPICGDKISEATGWENHHIEWRVHGGSDTMNNRVLLHPTCHRQVHCLG